MRLGSDPEITTGDQERAHDRAEHRHKTSRGRATLGHDRSLADYFMPNNTAESALPRIAPLRNSPLASFPTRGLHVEDRGLYQADSTYRGREFRFRDKNHQTRRTERHQRLRS